MKNFFAPRNIEIEDPPIAKFIFGNTIFSWVWLVIRVWLGWQWVSAAQHKTHQPRLDGHRQRPQGLLA